MEENRTYLCIDLKSFYASVECVERGLDPMKTNLVVADESRTEKTICLAVSPALKSFGVPGRPRLFEVIEKVREINALRKKKAPGYTLTGESYDTDALSSDGTLALSYLVAPPRMALYMDYSTRIYELYLGFVSPEDLHVYSVDEVFIDLTSYLQRDGVSARTFTREILRKVYSETGITATAGIGSNLYLCKVAMDIVAKKTEPDETGARIAQLDVESYRRTLWEHTPLTDFWRVGKAGAEKLLSCGLRTMGDVARCSLGAKDDPFNEDFLFKLFGISAELLIDHAWGEEPCTIPEIKAYRPQSSSLCSGQVLTCPYSAEKAGLVVREMTEQLVLELVKKDLVTDQLTLTLGYDVENLMNPEIRKQYIGEIKKDAYGRKIPKHAHGTANLTAPTSSGKQIQKAIALLFSKIADPMLLVRRITLTANRILPRNAAGKTHEQLNLFSELPENRKQREEEEAELLRERNMQKAMLSIREKYGKNAILRGMNLEEGATAIERNGQIGGHKA